MKLKVLSTDSADNPESARALFVELLNIVAASKTNRIAKPTFETDVLKGYGSTGKGDILEVWSPLSFMGKSLCKAYPKSSISVLI